MRPKSFAEMRCSIAQAVEVIGDRWTLLILRDALRGSTRFGEFHESLGIARNVLADRLESLVANGVLDRVQYQTKPDRFEYRLTPKGEDAYPVIVALLNWGDSWACDPAGPPLVLRHVDCGHPVAAAVVCEHCEAVVGSDDIRAEPGPAFAAQAAARTAQPVAGRVHDAFADVPEASPHPVQASSHTIQAVRSPAASRR